MTLRPDGMWRSLDPVEIYRSQSFATAVYRSELGREVQALGYRISVTAADGRWELQGYTREQVMAFSRRRQDIEALLNRQNSTGAAAAQIAAHQSRLAKEKRNENELRAEWQARAHDNRIALAEISERALARGPSQAVSPAATEEAVSFSVAHNTEREAVTDRRALERTALQYAMGIADLESVRRETGIRESRGELIALAVSPSFPASRLHHAGDGGAGARKSRTHARRQRARPGDHHRTRARAVGQPRVRYPPSRHRPQR